MSFAITKTGMPLADASNIADLRELARKRLPRGIFVRLPGESH